MLSIRERWGLSGIVYWQDDKCQIAIPHGDAMVYMTYEGLYALPAGTLINEVFRPLTIAATETMRRNGQELAKVRRRNDAEYRMLALVFTEMQ